MSQNVGKRLNSRSPNSRAQSNMLYNNQGKSSAFDGAGSSYSNSKMTY